MPAQKKWDANRALWVGNRPALTAFRATIPQGPKGNLCPTLTGAVDHAIAQAQPAAVQPAPPKPTPAPQIAAAPRDPDTEMAQKAGADCAKWRAYKSAYPRGKWIDTANGWLASSACTSVAVAKPPAVSPTTPLASGVREPEMVLIRGGTFQMGSPAGESERRSNEGPVHSVTVASFYAGKYEVTKDEYAACVSDGGCQSVQDDGFGAGQRPQTYVSWDDAKAYVAWLKRKTGKTYRLLTEEEWEYAARAGTTSAYSTGASISTSQANFNHTLGKTQPVGSYAANPWGLYDMHGNVWEWVEDCSSSNYNTTRDCAYRVIRGGSWDFDPAYLRSACRIWNSPTDRYNVIGFRVARTP